jgi:transposase
MSLAKLFVWVSKEFTRDDLFLMEAGSNSFEIHRRLLALGLRAIVMESCHVGKHAKTYADNDKMAAARIALVYLQGKAPCVWVPDALTRERRELLHAYNKAVVDRTAATNSLKGYLNQFTIRTGSRTLETTATETWVMRQRDWTPLQRELLAAYFRNLRFQTERRKVLLRLIGRQICAEPLMLRCMKLLGIGQINAFALLAVIGDVRRFERPEKLVAYIGLNPGKRESGRGKNIKLGVGKRGRGDMRHLLVQGAHAVLRMGRATALGQWGWKLFARRGNRNVAVAAVARKLVVQVWHLLTGNPPEALEPDKSLSTKLTKLAVMLGKSFRAELGLPTKVDNCVQHFQSKLLAKTIFTTT